MNLPKIEPYVIYNGRTAEALEFYKTALGAEIVCVMKFSDSPEPHPEGMTVDPDKVMHCAFTIGGSTVMASDGCGDDEPISGISLSLAVATEDEARRYFDALAADGAVTMPLCKTFWSPLFGMVKDKFGVHWMVGVLDPQCAG